MGINFPHSYPSIPKPVGTDGNDWERMERMPPPAHLVGFFTSDALLQLSCVYGRD